MVIDTTARLITDIPELSEWTLELYFMEGKHHVTLTNRGSMIFVNDDAFSVVRGGKFTSSIPTISEALALCTAEAAA